MLKNSKIGYNWIFQRVHLYIWNLAGHELSTPSIRAQNFNSWLISRFFNNFINIRWPFSLMIKQVRSSLTVHEFFEISMKVQLWNSIIFLNSKISLVVAPSVTMTHFVRKWICDLSGNKVLTRFMPLFSFCTS